MTTMNLDDVQLEDGKTAEQLIAERNQRLTDAYDLKQPDRIPISLNLSYMLSRMGGVTNQELDEDPDLCQELLERAALYFQPDEIMGGGWNGTPSMILGDRQTRWPGHGVAPDRPFQFKEGEYMKAEDYDEFIEDPSDFTLRTFLPRVYENLEGLALLQPLGNLLTGYAALSNSWMLTLPPIAKAMEALAKVAQAAAASGPIMMRNGQRMAALGYAPVPDFVCFAYAPFDFMGDTLRGTRGIMRDVLQRPEKLLAAMEKSRKITVKACVAAAKLTGGKTVMIPLHKGSDGFISIQQFETFYWPSLKAMILDMIEAGLRPQPFYEGVWDQRLHYLAELPKGKTRGMFERSNMAKVKDVVGDVMPIIGGFPVSLLQTGTVEQVQEYTQKMCAEVGKNGGFVMAASTAMDYCQPELVKAWVDATKRYGRY